MNKPAVTKAQLRRAVETLEAMGKVVGGVEILPDGRVHVLLTGATPAAPDPRSGDGTLEGLARTHGYG